MENLVWPAKETNLYKNYSDIIICPYVQGVYSHILENRYPRLLRKENVNFYKHITKRSINKQNKQANKIRKQKTNKQKKDKTISQVYCFFSLFANLMVH